MTTKQFHSATKRPQNFCLQNVMCAATKGFWARATHLQSHQCVLSHWYSAPVSLYLGANSSFSELYWVRVHFSQWPPLSVCRRWVFGGGGGGGCTVLLID